MTATPNQAAAKQFRSTDCNLTVHLGLLGPEAIRSITEHTYEFVQRTFDVVGQGAAAFNRRIIDLAQRNVISSFDLAKKLTAAKTLPEVVELQVAYWQKQFGLTPPAKQSEVPSLGIRVAADVGIPTKETRRMKDQVARNMDNAKIERVVNVSLKKQKSTDKKSIALAQSKVHRKTSGERSPAQRLISKKTSRKVAKKPSKGTK
jgi:hypothetical protein